MPVIFLLISLFAWLLFDLNWQEALLVGVVLSPTDPVIVSSLINHDIIPWQVRRILNIESGFNDGIALPILLILLQSIHREQPDILNAIVELVAGTTIGIVVPWIILRLQQTTNTIVQDIYVKLNILAIGILVFMLTHYLAINTFLACLQQASQLRRLNQKRAINSSILYMLLVWQASIPESNKIFNILALTLVISILAHSTSDF